MHHRYVVLFVILLPLICTACNSRAKVKLKPNVIPPQSVTSSANKDGSSTVRAQIDGADANTVYVKSKAGSSVGIARNDIESITHPGNVLRWVGLGVMAPGLLGAALTGYAYSNCDAADDPSTFFDGEALCEAVFLPLVITFGAVAVTGGILTVVGFTRHSGSRKRAEEGLSLSPFIVPTGDGDVLYGLGFGTRW